MTFGKQDLPRTASTVPVLAVIHAQRSGWEEKVSGTLYKSRWAHLQLPTFRLTSPCQVGCQNSVDQRST